MLARLRCFRWLAGPAQGHVAIVEDSIFIAWAEGTEKAHHDMAAAKPDMKDPKAVMPLPKVGSSQVYIRRVSLGTLRAGTDGKD